MSRPRRIRQLVQQQFSNIRSTDSEIQGETVLIRDSKYCGHRYHGNGLTAVWFLEEDQIKVYDASGRVASVVCPTDAFDPPVDRADAA